MSRIGTVILAAAAIGSLLGVAPMDRQDLAASERSAGGSSLVATAPKEPRAAAGERQKQPSAPSGSRQDCRVEPPPAAKAAGLTKLAFCDDFSSEATIDLDGTLRDGFKWYIAGLPYGFRGSQRQAYSVADGILSFRPDINQAQLSFLSAVVPRGARKPVGWYIDREVGGWYAEARLAHAETSLNTGFAAFWTMDMCHLYHYPAPCTLFVEPDFYEFIGGRDTRAVHLHQDPSGRKASKVDTWGTTRPGGGHGVDRQGFNTVAMRALPNVVTHYLNDNQVTEGLAHSNTSKGTFLWVGDVVAGPRASGGAVGRYPLMFGSGPEMPFKVDWVRVWVKP